MLLRYLGDLDGSGRSGEAGLAGLELAGWAEVSLREAVDSSHPEAVHLTRGQRLFLPALVVLRAGQLPLVEGLTETQVGQCHANTLLARYRSGVPPVGLQLAGSSG